MNRYIIAGLLIATPAIAQTPAPTVNFSITVTAQELDVIGNGLGSMPFKEAAPILQKLREQVVKQTTPPADAKPVESPK